MGFLFSKYSLWHLFLVILFFAMVGCGWVVASMANEEPYETTVVENGDIIQQFTSSGRLELHDVARVGFSIPGIINQVYKKVGDAVEHDEVIASLTTDAAVAQYNAAYERVRFSEEQKNALLKGANYDERNLASTQVAVAQANLRRIESEYEALLNNARKLLIASSLEAHPVDDHNDDTPPVISGSYLCDQEGQYVIELFRSAARSGLSYTLSGLGTGTYSANVSVPNPLGDCGLYIQFNEDEVYRNRVWVVDIPNIRSDSYIARKNEYELLQVQRDAAIRVAENELEVVVNMEKVTNTTATNESIVQAEARIAEAKELFAFESARVNDYIIRAPFSGIVSAVNMKVGEPVDFRSTVTVAKKGAYELKVKVPEMYVTKTTEGMTVQVKFDANKDEVLAGNVTYISIVASEVRGVSYYDTYVNLTDTPQWLREGLNADITFITNKKTGVATIPKRYIMNDASGQWLLIPTDTGVSKTPVSTGLVGANDLVEVLNIPLGTIVILPPTI